MKHATQAAVVLTVFGLWAAVGNAAESGRIERRPAATGQNRPADGVQSGRIAYYGREFEGRPTASGQKYDGDALTMAHRTLPFGTKVRITNPSNGRSVVVRVNDRGPQGRSLVGDVSLAAAKKLGFVDEGVIEARLEVVGSQVAER